MNPAQHDRNAAMFAAQGRMTNGAVPMGAPMGPRLRPNGGPAPGIQPIPRPTPPRVPPVSRLTGPNTKIPNSMDPANQYMNNTKEKSTAEPSSNGDELSSVRNLMTLLLFIILASSVFVIPEKFRFFWLVLVGLSVIMMIGVRVYTDLYEASKDEGKTEEERTKLSNFSGAILYAIFIVFSVVMAAILLVLAWKVYGQVNKNSNLVSDVEPTTDKEQVMMENRLEETMMYDAAPMRKKKKKKRFDPMF